MKANERRNTRTYKIKDGEYKKAQQRGAKSETAWATLIERVAYYYGQGWDIEVRDKSGQMTRKLN